MTRELFLEDSYRREFRAGVKKIEGREVVLEETAFFPGGGGQPADKGTLSIGPINAAVVDARREWGVIIHVLDRAVPGTVKELNGALDWERRYAHMRYHTA
ncbi:MAG TPA: alanyl-tRNA editing protein, partial [Rubrobacter sp.]|nr:alanyl-tRNA editing protein [Rubrobacter sp.]